MPWISLSILFPIAFALFIPLLPDNHKVVKWYGLGVTLTTFLITVVAYITGYDPSVSGLQMSERVPWVPNPGSYLVCGCRWSIDASRPSDEFYHESGLCCMDPLTFKPKLFYFLLLLMDGGQIAVFAVQDLILFFLSWELELVPVYLMLAIYGGKKRQYAATKFILYTAGSSLFILLSGLAMGFWGGGTPNFEYAHLAEQGFPLRFQLLCYAGFLISFGVKLPIVPLHTWLPDAHGDYCTSSHVVGRYSSEDGWVCSTQIQLSTSSRSTTQCLLHF